MLNLFSLYVDKNKEDNMKNDGEKDSDEMKCSSMHFSKEIYLKAEWLCFFSKLSFFKKCFEKNLG